MEPPRPPVIVSGNDSHKLKTTVQIRPKKFCGPFAWFVVFLHAVKYKKNCMKSKKNKCELNLVLQHAFTLVLTRS